MLNQFKRKIKKKNSQMPSYQVLLLCSKSRTGRLHLCFKINFVLCYRLCCSVFTPAWSCLLQKNLSKFLACGYPINYVAILEGKWNKTCTDSSLSFLAVYPLPSGLENPMPEASPWHISCLTAKSVSFVICQICQIQKKTVKFLEDGFSLCRAYVSQI